MGEKSSSTGLMETMTEVAAKPASAMSVPSAGVGTRSSARETETGCGWFQSSGENTRVETSEEKPEPTRETRATIFDAGFAESLKEMADEPPSGTSRVFVVATSW